MLIQILSIKKQAVCSQVEFISINIVPNFLVHSLKIDKLCSISGSFAQHSTRFYNSFLYEISKRCFDFVLQVLSSVAILNQR